MNDAVEYENSLENSRNRRIGSFQLEDKINYKRINLPNSQMIKSHNNEINIPNIKNNTIRVFPSYRYINNNNTLKRINYSNLIMNDNILYKTVNEDKNKNNLLNKKNIKIMKINNIKKKLGKLYSIKNY